MIQPDEGNYNIAQQGRRAIRHVLDQVISVAFAPLTSGQDDLVQGNGDEEIDFAEMGFLDNIDIDDRAPFLGWLDGTTEAHEPCMAWMNFT